MAWNDRAMSMEKGEHVPWPDWLVQEAPCSYSVGKMTLKQENVTFLSWECQRCIKSPNSRADIYWRTSVSEYPSTAGRADWLCGLGLSVFYFRGWIGRHIFFQHAAKEARFPHMFMGLHSGKVVKVVVRPPRACFMHIQCACLWLPLTEATVPTCTAPAKNGCKR